MQRCERTIHNQTLYTESKNFIMKALPIIKSSINQNPQKSNLDLVNLIFSHQVDFENIPEFKQCTNIMENDPDISKHIGNLVGVKGRLSSARSWDYLRRILSRLTRAYQKKKRFDERLFRSLYLDMEKLFYGKTIPLVIFIPLQNFESNISYAWIDNYLSIRKITDDERQQYLTDQLQYLKLTFSEAIRIKYIVEYEFDENKVFDEQPANMDRIDTIRKVITLLRLSKQGDVGYYLILERTMLDTPILPGIIQLSSTVGFPEGKTYTLMKNELRKFRKYWSIINKIDIRRFSELGIALRRFESAYEKTSADDKLLDYVICLELLLGKDDRDSLTYKISVRFSRLCTRDSKKRKEYRCLMSDIYQLRSAIVHGNEHKGKKLWKKLTINIVEEKLREAIWAYIGKIGELKRTEKNNKIDHSKIIDRIDFG
jgi:hypothetical protein